MISGSHVVVRQVYNEAQSGDKQCPYQVFFFTCARLNISLKCALVFASPFAITHRGFTAVNSRLVCAVSTSRNVFVSFHEAETEVANRRFLLIAWLPCAKFKSSKIDNHFAKCDYETHTGWFYANTWPHLGSYSPDNAIASQSLRVATVARLQHTVDVPFEQTPGFNRQRNWLYKHGSSSNVSVRVRCSITCKQQADVSEFVRELGIRSSSDKEKKFNSRKTAQKARTTAIFKRRIIKTGTLWC